MIEVLHLTPHLGGGVGKALAGLVEAAQKSSSSVPVKHVLVCLERMEKDQFARRIQAAGCDLVIQPDQADLESRIAAADILQLEWWNHPATLAALCALSPQSLRLLVWCHQSGLINPIIPAGLADSAHRFVLTSPCSLQAKNIADSTALKDGRVSVISSGVGCDELPPVPARDLRKDRSLAVGYLGSLNFSKLHPDYIAWLSAVESPDFRVRLIGDELNRAELEHQCVATGRPDLIEFCGYREDVAAELSRLDVLAYLLNPRHYGTAENALLEAMAMGVVPVVLNNPAERAIVAHGDTGLIVSSPGEFSAAIEYLDRYPVERAALGERAANMVRAIFTGHRVERAFREKYESLTAEPKKRVDFGGIFGATPAAWFLACQGDQDVFIADGKISMRADNKVPHDLLEKSKGSVFHFLKHFPRDPVIGKWANALAGRMLS